MSRYPIPGTAIILFHADRRRILLGQRLNTDHEPNAYGTPGGKIEFGQSPYGAILDELKQETDLGPENLCRPIEALPFVSSEVYPEEDSHYICFWFWAILHPSIDEVPFIEIKDGKPKQRGWKFHDIDDLPPKLMRSCSLAISIASIGLKNFTLVHDDGKVACGSK